MAEAKSEETYYDVLKIPSTATIAEIVNAYHSAKNAFSRDSVATYSLFSSDEAKGILDRLEEAYLTLSNIDRRREYDKFLLERAQNPLIPPAMSELEKKQAARALPKDKPPAAPVDANPPPGAVADNTPITVSAEEPFSGGMLREIRQKRALSLDDVSRITKIPSKFIRAIESDDLKRMPARVYIQGFIKNLASLYKLDAPTTSRAYLIYLDKLQETVQGN